MPDESKNGKWAKYVAMMTMATFVLGGLFWVFQVWMTATEARALAMENRQTLKESLEQKADKDDIQDLKQEIRDLNKQIQDLHEDLDNSAFIKHARHKDQDNGNN